MRVFTLNPVEAYEHITTVYDADPDPLTDFDGTSRKAGWSPVEIEISNVGERRRRLRHADVPFLGSWTLILRDRALDLAGPIVAPFGELLPLTCADANVALFNSLETLDAVDEDASTLVRFSTGRIMTIEKYAFRPGVIPERAIFRIPQGRFTVFYTERVVDELMALGLTGLDFKRVPGSDGG